MLIEVRDVMMKLQLIFTFGLSIVQPGALFSIIEKGLNLEPAMVIAHKIIVIHRNVSAEVASTGIYPAGFYM